MEDVNSERRLPMGPRRPRRWTRAVLVSAIACLAPFDLAWSGGEGGSIGGAIGGGSGGGDGGGGSMGGKITPPSSSGKPRREPQKAERHDPPVARRARRSARYEPASRQRGGSSESGGASQAGKGSFNGSWTVTTNTNCGPSSTGVMRISNSRLYARTSFGSTSGSVSPNGSVHAVGHYSGRTQYTSGRLSGSSGGGSFRDSGGCTGSWSASR